jgi:hypothetical protein
MWMLGPLCREERTGIEATSLLREQLQQALRIFGPRLWEGVSVPWPGEECNSRHEDLREGCMTSFMMVYLGHTKSKRCSTATQPCLQLKVRLFTMSSSYGGRNFTDFDAL